MELIFVQMTYQQTVEYLFTRLPMFSRIGAAAIKKDLHNTLALCDSLDNPHRKLRSIHIAGTNGKGSVSHMLAAILQEAGYKTGLYTSPHLYDFRERIKVNGLVCPEEFVVDFTKRIQPQIDALEPSFFEITVAMAFDYFAKEQVDIAVIETGLGGRLDSTNVVIPDLSVITNIGWDHMQLLGNTLPLIAAEKAGIIKPGVPVVIGEAIPETRPVFEEKASSVNAPIYFAEEQRYTDSFKPGRHFSVTVHEKQHDEKQEYMLDLPGVYQRKNLLTVLEAVSQLRGLNWNISPSQVLHALKNVQKLTGLHGRWETIREHPRVVLDVAHNVNGIEQLKEQLELETWNALHIVLGMVKDKDVNGVLALLPKDATYYFTSAQIPRAMPATDLQALAESCSLHGNIYDDVNTALNAATNNANMDDLVLVCGSVFLVAEVNRP